MFYSVQNFHNQGKRFDFSDRFFKLNNLKMDNKIINLAHKLLALARRGEGGEKQNAQLKLDSLMCKHNITMSQLEGEQVTMRRFYITSDAEQTILFQIAAKVLNQSELRFFTRRDERTKRFFGLNLTDAQFLDIDAHFTFYSSLFEKEQKVFIHAFVQSNNLFSKQIDKTPTLPKTDAEMKEEVRMLSMAQTIKSATFQKPLNA